MSGVPTLDQKKEIAGTTIKYLKRFPLLFIAYYMGYRFTVAFYCLISIGFIILAILFFQIQTAGTTVYDLPCNYSGKTMPIVSKIMRGAVCVAVVGGLLFLYADRPGANKGKGVIKKFKVRARHERIRFKRVILMCSTLYAACCAFSNDVVIWKVFSTASNDADVMNQLTKFIYGATCILSVIFMLFHLLNGGKSPSIPPDSEFPT